MLRSTGWMRSFLRRRPRCSLRSLSSSPEWLPEPPVGWRRLQLAEFCPPQLFRDLSQEQRRCYDATEGSQQLPPQPMGSFWYQADNSGGSMVRFRVIGGAMSEIQERPLTSDMWEEWVRRGMAGSPVVVLDESRLGASEPLGGSGGNVVYHQVSFDGSLSAYTVDWHGTDRPDGYVDWMGPRLSGPPRRIGTLPKAFNLVFVGHPRPVGILTTEPDERLRCRTVHWRPISWPEQDNPSPARRKEGRRGGGGGGVRAPLIGPPERLWDEQSHSLFVDVSTSKDGQLSCINCNDRRHSEIWAVVNVGEGKSRPSLRRLVPRSAEVQAFVEHAPGGVLLLTTAGDAPTFRVRFWPDKDWMEEGEGGEGGEEEWGVPGWDVIPPDPQWAIEDMDVFSQATDGRPPVVLVYERSTSTGTPRVRWGMCDPLRLGENVPLELHDIALPDDVCAVEAGMNQDPGLRFARLTLRRATAPAWEVALDLQTGELHPIANVEDVFDAATVEADTKKPESAARRWLSFFTGGNDGGNEGDSRHSTRLRSDRMLVRSLDGTMVPFVVTAPRSRWRDSSPSSSSGSGLRHGPVLVLGYGCYGHVLDPSFTCEWAPLWRRGWGVVFAQVRGGGDLGPTWHEAGRGRNKGRSVDDLMSVIRFVQEVGWCDAQSTVLRGESAGGWLASLAMTRMADRLAAVVLRSPFTHLSDSMMDPSLPLTVPEYREWGEPGDVEDASGHWLSLCPVSSIRPQQYPPVFAWASARDARVRSDHTMEFMALVEAAHALSSATGKGMKGEEGERVSPAYLVVDEGGTHAGPTEASEAFDLHTMELAWMIHHTTPPPQSSDKA